MYVGVCVWGGGGVGWGEGGGAGGGGAYADSQTTVLHMKKLNQNESPIFVILCSLFPKAILFDFYITLLPCGSPYIIVVQVIFYFPWDHWAHPGYFENRIPLKPALGGVCGLANYSVVYEETQSNRLRYLWFCVFFVSKGNRFWLIFYSTVAGVVLCGGRKNSPRTSS